MSVRRDQVDAQKYVNRRLVSALLTSDANAPESPLRSVGRATIVSVLIGALVVVGFIAYGFVSRGGSTDWQSEGTVVVARETGTRYVYLSGALHPVANLTSARLIAGDGATEVVYVSENSIADALRGEPLGILGAPDAVPTVDELVHDEWTACSALVELESGFVAASVQVGPGAPEPRVVLPPEQAVLIEVDGEPELVWDGARWPIEDADTVLTAFNQPGARPFEVGAAWANVVSSARGRLDLPEIVGRGDEAGRIAGRPALVGMVYLVELEEDDQFYVAYEDGLLPVPDPIAALVLADPRTSEVYGDDRVSAIRIDAATVNTVGLSAEDELGATLPDVVPELVNDQLKASTGLCATYPTLAEGGGITVSLVAPLVLEAPDGVPGSPTDYVVADTVSIDPGHGALVQAVLPSGEAGGTVYVITDQGVKYPLAGDDAISALGFDGVTPDPLPRTLLDVIPTGPSLDPVDARSVVTLPSPS